jgi:hypothetical protein
VDAVARKVRRGYRGVIGGPEWGTLLSARHVATHALRAALAPVLPPEAVSPA